MESEQEMDKDARALRAYNGGDSQFRRPLGCVAWTLIILAIVGSVLLAGFIALVVVCTSAG